MVAFAKAAMADVVDHEVGRRRPDLLQFLAPLVEEFVHLAHNVGVVLKRVNQNPDVALRNIQTIAAA